jgi:hypothetical protein
VAEMVLMFSMLTGSAAFAAHAATASVAIVESVTTNLDWVFMGSLS